ncbi:MAG: nitrilase-related carbon-nitrogen hydrolase [Vicinamibacteria bacterium]
MPLLFSYGTLQEERVQLATFGRRLRGESDALPGYEPSLVRIADARFVAESGRTHHANVVASGRAGSRVAGTAFEVTEAELAAADRYEAPAAYARTEAVLASGRRAWLYVHASSLGTDRRGLSQNAGMSLVRIALANLPFPPSPDASIAAAERAIADAAAAGADIVCFPECFVPGYRAAGKDVPPPDAAFLERAWAAVARAAGAHDVAVVLGTERLVDGALLIAALVVDRDGTVAGFQDKVQLDPSEEGPYVAGSGRRVFRSGPLTFGVAICHEGWRSPETVRAAARQGAHVVFHPQFHEAEPGGFRPATYADPANTFHEKAALCRAAENTCYFATVNFASDGSPTTSAVVRPDGTLLAYQPYGQAGLLIADIDTAQATGLLASRCKAN